VRECLEELAWQLAACQQFDGLRVEYGVVKDLMVDVEDRGLADKKDLRVWRKHHVDGSQRGVEPPRKVGSKEGQFPRPFVKPRQCRGTTDPVTKKRNCKNAPAEDSPRQPVGPIGPKSRQDRQAGK